MFVACSTKLNAWKLDDIPFEYPCHIVVELVGIRAYVHGYDSLVKFIPAVVNFVFQKFEVGDGLRIVVFEGIGIQADKLDTSGNETEIGITENGSVGFFASSQTVVVANQGMFSLFIMSRCHRNSLVTPKSLMSPPCITKSISFR